MITIYESTATTFETNGLGVLTPLSCQVTETLNGEYELTLVHPIDEAGKWKKLLSGRIIRAPVPAAMTPVSQFTEEVVTPATVTTYQVSTSGQRLRLRSGPSTSSSTLDYYDSGTIVTFLEASGSWYKVQTPDGKTGYMASSNLVRNTTSSQSSVITRDVLTTREMKDQPFRIYKVTRELTKITAYTG